MVRKWRNNKKKPTQGAGQSAHKPSSATVSGEHSAGLSTRLYRQTMRSRRFQLLVAGAILLVAGGVGYVVLVKPRPISQQAPTVDQSDELSYRQSLLKTEGYEASYADYLILGNEYETQNDYKKAEAQYKQAEKMDAANFDVIYALAKVYRLQKNKDASVRYYDKVITAASSESSDQHVNLKLYQAERQAVLDGDFDLKQVEYPNDTPL